MKLRTPYLLIFLLVLARESRAQTQDVKFTDVGGSSGIFLGKINNVTRDKYGFLWLSDQFHRCIIRYDGSKMITFANNPKDSNSLGGTYPECLVVDSAGIIW